MTARTPEEEYEEQNWRDALGTAPKRDFTQRVFACTPAMVKKELVKGARMWSQYDPAKFTKEEYDIVEGMWDHEHCAVCWHRILTGDTYWQNSQNFILCPGCHEKFQKRE
jgi:hypothetical protein